jgi:hypothetical protein
MELLTDRDNPFHGYSILQVAIKMVNQTPAFMIRQRSGKIKMSKKACCMNPGIGSSGAGQYNPGPQHHRHGILQRLLYCD